MSTSRDCPRSYDDIETGPESEEIIRKFTKPFQPFNKDKVLAGIKRKFATANDPLKGPKFTEDKLEAARVEHAEKEAEYWEKAIDNAALDPLTGRILAIGMRQNGVNRILIAENDAEEKEMLQEYLNHVTEIQSKGGTIYGFNWEGFDNGFVIARCMKHKLDWQILRNGRYQAAVFRDLLKDWQGSDRTNYISLDMLAEYLGTEHRKNGDGALFAQTLKEDRAKAIEYLGNDLIMTEEVAVGLGVAPEFVPEMVQEASATAPDKEGMDVDDIPFVPTPRVMRPLGTPRILQAPDQVLVR